MHFYTLQFNKIITVSNLYLFNFGWTRNVLQSSNLSQMKYISLLLLLIGQLAVCQNNFPAEDKQILGLEVQRHEAILGNQEIASPFIGDSVLVSKSVLKPEGMKRLRTVAADSIATPSELLEIFGTEEEAVVYTPNIDKGTVWPDDTFPEYKAVLFSKAKYKNRKKEFAALASSDMLFISRPMINKERTYAMVQTRSKKTGKKLSIYKYSSEGWTFYKSFLIS